MAGGKVGGEIISRLFDGCRALRSCLLIGCWLSFCCGLLVESAWAAPALDTAAIKRVRQRLSSGVLVWAGDAEGGAPYQLRDPEHPGQVVGFEVEIADGIAKQISLQIGAPLKAEFKQYEWASLEQGLMKIDFDLILAGFEQNDDNHDRFRFSRPYYAYGQQLAVRADETRIKTLADCIDHPVATMDQTAAHKLMQRMGIKHISAFTGQIEPYFVLEQGRVDAVLLDTPIFQYYAAPNPRLKAVGPPLGEGFYKAVMRLDDVDLAAAVDHALSQLMIDGTLRDIDRKWHLWNADQVRLAQGPQRTEELQGLGIADGKLVDESTLPQVTPVNRNLVASSSQSWTFSRYAPILIAAAGTTILISVLSMALAMLWGLCIALCRLYAPAPVRSLALVYVEFFRGIPQLLVLFFIYYGLPSFGITVDSMTAAITGFALVYAAYESEIYRSAILSVPRGQWEAARALGMTEPLAFRRVVLPQAIRTALGPMTNDFVAMFKDTSLVSVIAVNELTKEYMILSRSTLKFVEMGLLTAALYLAMSIPLGYLSRYLEQRWGTK